MNKIIWSSIILTIELPIITPTISKLFEFVSNTIHLKILPFEQTSIEKIVKNYYFYGFFKGTRQRTSSKLSSNFLWEELILFLTHKKL